MSARKFDVNGWYEIPRNPLSKAGVFPFRGSSIRAPDPNKMYNVYRPAEELSSLETMASLRLLPWVKSHTMLAGNTPETSSASTGYLPPEMKGVHGVIGENVYFDQALQTLYSNIKCFSNSLAQDIENGLEELSLGYRCKYDWTPGVFQGQSYDCVQRNIRFNHGASVPQGRMGPEVAVLDSVDGVEVVCFDGKDFVIMATKVNDKRVKAWLSCFPRVEKGKIVLPSAATIVGMDAAEKEAAAEPDAAEPSLSDVVSMLKQIGPQIADVMACMQGMMAPPVDPLSGDMEPAMDAEGKPMMGADGKPVMKKKGAPPPAPPVPVATSGGMDAAEVERRIKTAVDAAVASFKTPKALLEEISQRNLLAERLSGFVGTFDASDMTLSDVAKYGVEKLKLPAVAAGSEVAAINAYLFNRKPVHETVSGGDAAPKSTKLDAYLSGEKK